MDQRRSRRFLVQSAVSASFLAAGASHSLAAQSSSIASGGIGMPLTDWETVFGPGDPGQSYMVYTYPTFSATMHVGVDRSSNADGIVDYFYIPLENSQYAEGMDPELAHSMIMSLLPHDARPRQMYQRNETPGSIVQVTTEIWTSRSLGLALNGRRSILVRSTIAPPDVMTRIEIDVEKG